MSSSCSAAERCSLPDEPRFCVPFADPAVQNRSPKTDHRIVCPVLSKEWGMGYGDDHQGLYRDYYRDRDPFPHSLLSTGEL